MDNPQTIISLCTGIRGLERGLERAIGKINVAAYVEIETFICENLLSGMESGLVAPAPIWTDVKTFPSEQFHGKIHGIIGGYPCQPFSVAGKQKGKEDPRHLFPHILEIIKSVRPVWCFFENVSGHLSLGYDEVYRSLSDLGYSVEAGIFTAEEVGAPHRRERLFILAIANELGQSFSDGYSGRHPKSGFKIRQSESGRLQQFEGTGSELGNTQGIYVQRCKYEQGQRESWRTGRVLANTNSETKRRTENRTEGRKIYQNFRFDRDCFWCESTRRSKVIPNSDNQGLQRNREFNGQERRENQNGHFGSRYRWPSRPNEPQHEWEEPRTTFRALGCNANGNQDRINNLYLKGIYETYSGKKERAIKELHDLWNFIDSESDKWTFGRLFSFLEKEILFTEMYGNIKNKRISHIAATPEKILSFKERDLRELWFEKIIEHPSQRQECFQQLRREFADAMCILSYQITLARRKDTTTGKEDYIMQYLSENYKDSWWNVPETLSEIQEIWRPVSDKTCWHQQIKESYKGYRLEIFGDLYGYNFREDLLRAFGNAVVEQTAELAFRTLIKKFGL